MWCRTPSSEEGKWARVGVLMAMLERDSCPREGSSGSVGATHPSSGTTAFSSLVWAPRPSSSSDDLHTQSQLVECGPVTGERCARWDAAVREEVCPVHSTDTTGRHTWAAETDRHSLCRFYCHSLKAFSLFLLPFWFASALDTRQQGGI